MMNISKTVVFVEFVDHLTWYRVIIHIKSKCCTEFKKEMSLNVTMMIVKAMNENSTKPQAFKKEKKT